jgi:hypothetical protein
MIQCVRIKGDRAWIKSKKQIQKITWLTRWPQVDVFLFVWGVEKDLRTDMGIELYPEDGMFHAC